MAVTMAKTLDIQSDVPDFLKCILFWVGMNETTGNDAWHEVCPFEWESGEYGEGQWKIHLERRARYDKSAKKMLEEGKTWAEAIVDAQAWFTENGIKEDDFLLVNIWW